MPWWPTPFINTYASTQSAMYTYSVPRDTRTNARACGHVTKARAVIHKLGLSILIISERDTGIDLPILAGRRPMVRPYR